MIHRVRGEWVKYMQDNTDDNLFTNHRQQRQRCENSCKDASQRIMSGTRNYFWR